MGDDDMGIRKNDERCFIDTHHTKLLFSLECISTGPRKEIFFEDKTRNHNKVLVEVFRTDASFCHLFVLIKTRGKHDPIKREIPRFFDYIDTSEYGPLYGNLALQVEDVEWVALLCDPRTVPTPYPGPPSPAPIDACEGFLKITKTFCICCEED